MSLPITLELSHLDCTASLLEQVLAQEYYCPPLPPLEVIFLSQLILHLYIGL